MVSVAAVTMVRNAIDLVDDFLAHHLDIVDRIYIADHLSDDGTYELLRARAQDEVRIEVVTYDFEQYFQGAVITALSKRAVAGGADWILPLDVDEFLPYQSKEELLSVLTQSGERVVRFEWQNCVPKKFPESSGPLDWDSPFLALPDEPSSSKIAVASDLVRRGDFRVGMGSHAIEFGGERPPTPPLVGRLLHFPLRSMDQARAKFEVFGHSYQAMHADKPKSTKSWFVFGRLFESGLGAAEVQSIALRYPKSDRLGSVDQAVSVTFRPNRQFAGRPRPQRTVKRSARHSPLTKSEARATVRGSEIALHAPVLWRTRRALRRAGSTGRRLWYAVTLRLRAA